MGFRKDKTTAAQTAANVAGGVASAAIAKGIVSEPEEAASYAVVVFEALFELLGPVVDADNLVFEAAEGAAVTTAKTASSGGKRSSKTSGGSKKRSGGGSSITVDDARQMELNGGAFKGVTLGELLDINIDQAEDDYGYGNGERDGRDYLSWLASDSYENEYVQLRARLIADAEGIDY